MFRSSQTRTEVSRGLIRKATNLVYVTHTDEDVSQVRGIINCQRFILTTGLRYATCNEGSEVNIASKKKKKVGNVRLNQQAHVASLSRGEARSTGLPEKIASASPEAPRRAQPNPNARVTVLSLFHQLLQSQSSSASPVSVPFSPALLCTVWVFPRQLTDIVISYGLLLLFSALLPHNASPQWTGGKDERGEI